jgi:hypothetical protein
MASHYIKSVINFLVLSKDIQKSPDLISDMFIMLYLVEEVFRFKEDSYEVLTIAHHRTSNNSFRSGCSTTSARDCSSKPHSSQHELLASV